MNELTNAIPEIVNLTSNIQKEEVKGFLENLIGEYGWLLFAAVLTFLAKDMIMNFVQGLLVFMGKDFNNDELLRLFGEQLAIKKIIKNDDSFII